MGNLPVLREDPISYGLVAISISLLIYLTTFGGLLAQDSLIAVIIILSSFALMRWGGFFEQAPYVSVTREKSYMYYVAIALATFLLLNIFVPSIPLGIEQLDVASSFYVSAAFGVLMAVAEEQFFRGFFLNFCLIKIRLPPTLAFVVNGIFFGTYHLAVYGGSTSSIMIVAGAGMIMSYVDYKTGSVTPSTLAHIANNILAFGGI